MKVLKWIKSLFTKSGDITSTDKEFIADTSAGTLEVSTFPKEKSIKYKRPPAVQKEYRCEQCGSLFRAYPSQMECTYTFDNIDMHCPVLCLLCEEERIYLWHRRHGDISRG